MHFRFLYASFLAQFLFIFPYHATVDAQDIIGTWQGEINSLYGDFRVVIHVKENESHELAATSESPDISTKISDVDIEVKGDSLFLSLPRGGEYAGKYNKDSSAYLGTIKQHGYKLPLKLVKGETADVLYKRPQNPLKPYPYKEEEVTIINRSEHDTLAGTFSKPNGNGKFPVAILLTGSGAQDRDESIKGHRPFLILADFLTRKGFAVLRCDDRGTAKSTGNFKASTTADFETDAEAQLDYLKTRPDVDKKHIGIIGHSEGGVIAPMVAVKRKEISFIVLMAGPAMNSFDLMIMQDSLVELSDGTSATEINSYLIRQRKLFSIARSSLDSATAADSIDRMLTVEKASDREIEKAITQVVSPWFRWFIRYDPQENLKKLHCEVLAINGEKDIQVPAAANIAATEEALKSSKSKNYYTTVLPGLNHLFQKCRKCNVSEYKKINETIDPLALSTIGDWMEKNVLKKK